MRIFRCHHKFGFQHGPFSGDYATGFRLNIDLDIHPPPRLDGLLGMFGQDGFFGCVDLKAIDIWFGKSIEVLTKNKFMVTEFEIDSKNVVVGLLGTQCRFLLSKATPIRTMTVQAAVNESLLHTVTQ